MKHGIKNIKYNAVHISTVLWSQNATAADFQTNMPKHNLSIDFHDNQM